MPEPTMVCRLLQRPGKRLPQAPFPGPLGQRVFEEISEEGWNIWLEQQTQLLNEQRLDLSAKSDRKWLFELMTHFLFDAEGLPESDGGSA